MENDSRRKFIKYGLASIGAFAASTIAFTLDKGAGLKIGRHSVDIGMSEASGQCGIGAGCAGGGGQCGIGAGCAGS